MKKVAKKKTIKKTTKVRKTKSTRKHKGEKKSSRKSKKSDHRRADKVYKLILDTSIFVNPEIRSSFGETPKEALENFLDIVKDIKEVEFYMAPSAWGELKHFVEDAPAIAEIKIIKRPPSIQEMFIPSGLIYDFVSEMRDRINRGLRIVEKGVRSENTDENIRKFRNQYREALRYGIVDSIADLDTLLLAKEIDGIVVAVDEGLIKWAKKLGVPYINAKKLKALFDLLAISK